MEIESSESDSKKVTEILLIKSNKLYSENPWSKTRNSICLRKDLWIEILGYLDMRTYFLTIPQINSYFYHLIKESKCLKTTLDFNLELEKTSYEKDKILIRYILENKNLKKLELKLLKNSSITKITKDLFSMSALKTLKILKLCSYSKRCLQIHKLLFKMDNLEELKIHSLNISTETILFILKNYIENSKNTPTTNAVFKKLSLKSSNIDTCKMIESLEINTGLEKFSIINIGIPDMNKSDIIYLDNFNPSKYLKIIKLPNVTFNDNQADEFFSYLENTQILEEIHLCDRIINFYQKFIDAILINRSLKILHFIPGFAKSEKLYGMPYEIFFKILEAVTHNYIEDFSAMTCALIKSSYNILDIDVDFIYENPDRILESLVNFLASERIRKLDVCIPIMPYKYYFLLAELVVNYAQLGKIENFAGYNVKRLIENNMEVLVLKKPYYYIENYIVLEILKLVLPKADKVLKIIDYNQENCIDVREFLMSINESKKLVLKETQKNLKDISKLYSFSMIILSTRIKGLTEINIVSSNIRYCNSYGFSELLKEFKTLQKLKIRENISDRIVANFNYISKLFASNLKNISYIKFSGFIISCENLISILTSLTGYNALRKFKLKDCSLIEENGILYDILANFIANSYLVSLNFSNIDFKFTLKDIKNFARALENNQILTHLRLEEIPSITISENFMIILSSLESKTNYEKISINSCNKMSYDNSLTDDNLYLAKIDKILMQNQSLRLFNIRLCVSEKEIFKYSEILLNALDKI